jgi:glycosyltransferase involved in cell wall biosynthesis
MTSVVIAAHNEEPVIGRCLDALLAGVLPGDLDVTVVANGCTDATAEVAAARPGVRVLTLPDAGKSAALNAADAVAVGFPRVYLDADVVLSPGAVPALVAALSPAGGEHPASAEPAAGAGPGDVTATGPGPGDVTATGPGPGDVAAAPLAVVPRRVLDLSGRPVAVRAYYHINGRLPAYRHALFGRGAVALSAAGRARFDRFPDLTADDLYLDSLFAAHEKAEVEQAVSVVATPFRTRDLLRRLIRVRAGNAAIRASTDASTEASTGTSTDGATGVTAGGTVRTPAVRGSVRTSWLRDVVLPRPWLAPAAVCYVAITLIAALAARRRSTGAVTGWGRDESTRPPVGQRSPRSARAGAESPR